MEKKFLKNLFYILQFINSARNFEIMIKNVKYKELNTNIATVFLNT